MRSRTAVMFSLSVLVLLACQGPEGPMGPSGPQGPTGETGSAGEAGPQGEAGPLDYLLVSAVSIIPESEELETPTLAVAEGALLIQDPNGDLLRTALESFLEEMVIHLAVLVVAG